MKPRLVCTRLSGLHTSQEWRTEETFFPALEEEERPPPTPLGFWNPRKSDRRRRPEESGATAGRSDRSTCLACMSGPKQVRCWELAHQNCWLESDSFCLFFNSQPSKQTSPPFGLIWFNAEALPKQFSVPFHSHQPRGLPSNLAWKIPGGQR